MFYNIVGVKMGKLVDHFLNHNGIEVQHLRIPKTRSVGDTSAVMSLVLVILYLCKLLKLVLTENSCAGVK